MIAYLEGTLREKSPTLVVVLAGGVGYRVFIPVSTFYELPDEGANVSLRVYTHVREDVLALYGFITSVEEQLFGRLIGVAGVGPALALKIMSGLEAPALVSAIRGGDLRRLNAIPGVGKKTAERLILELRDKMSSLAATEPSGRTPPASSIAEDLVSALANLGFARPQAQREVDRVLREAPEVRFEEALKTVLRRLSQ
ncbi:MAG TPA: Holliday junction branch migration protein RuvA [Vicinamibacteria bacterium]|nr:Holliday junction branch migration protein RuvA [Vicinamibacteria bacterium]